MKKSVSKISCSQEAGRSVSDLGILARLGSGAHRAGGGKIRLGEFPIPRRWKDPSRKFLVPRRGAHRAGGWKIRLGDFLLLGDGKIRLGPSELKSLKERLSPGWRLEDPSWGFLAPRRWKDLSRTLELKFVRKKKEFP